MSSPRSGPANSVTSEDGMRWYVFGEGETAERYVSVTTALGLVDKEGLRRWATSLSADAAFNELPKVIKASRTRDCGNTFKRCGHDFRQRCTTCPCGECGACVRRWIANRHYYESSRRAEEGSRLHDIAEHWVLSGGEIRDHGDDVAPYVVQWQQWITDYGLTPDSWEMTEATVVNREHGYAGTLDGIVTFHADATPAAAELVAKLLQVPVSQTGGRVARPIVDFKTREKEEAKLYPEHALQQAGYRNGEVVRLRDGREMPMPATDGAVIVQIRPGGYLCQPVVTDEMTYAAFLAELAFARWYFEYSTASVSTRSFPLPKEPPALKVVKPAAAKKAPARKASPRKAADPAKAAVNPVIQQLKAWPAQTANPHPNSLYQDEVPF